MNDDNESSSSSICGTIGTCICIGGGSIIGASGGSGNNGSLRIIMIHEIVDSDIKSSTSESVSGYTGTSGGKTCGGGTRGSGGGSNSGGCKARSGGCGGGTLAFRMLGLT